MFNVAKQAFGENLIVNNKFFGSVYNFYKQSKSERLAEAVIKDYFSGQELENKEVEICHSDQAKENCRGLNCQPIVGKVTGKPFLSNSRKSLLVNIENQSKKCNIVSLMIKDGLGWRSTGWELTNVSDKEK